MRRTAESEIETNARSGFCFHLRYHATGLAHLDATLRLLFTLNIAPCRANELTKSVLVYTILKVAGEFAEVFP